MVSPCSRKATQYLDRSVRHLFAGLTVIIRYCRGEIIDGSATVFIPPISLCNGSTKPTPDKFQGNDVPIFDIGGPKQLVQMAVFTVCVGSSDVFS